MASIGKGKGYGKLARNILNSTNNHLTLCKKTKRDDRGLRKGGRSCRCRRAYATTPQTAASPWSGPCRRPTCPPGRGAAGGATADGLEAQRSGPREGVEDGRPLAVPTQHAEERLLHAVEHLDLVNHAM